MRVGDVFDLGVWLDPVDPFSLLFPETFRIINRALIHLEIFFVIDEGVFGNLVRHRKK